ncbi:MAG: translation initiation factor, partial [Acidobacteria bacterium]|nr:translation initiation factor [Acidobacteriota bacterium]
MSLGRNRIFLKSVARNFKRTGAVAPSSRSLGNAMICELVRNYRSPVRVLEVGGGTGNITEVIAGALRPEDHLDVFEIDEELSRVLRRRLA